MQEINVIIVNIAPPPTRLTIIIIGYPKKVIKTLDS